MKWLMLPQDTPKDFVIATGKQISVREFVSLSAANLGIQLEFSGEGQQETGTVVAIDADVADPEMTTKVGDVIVKVDPDYYRPADVETLLGDPSTAKAKLGWERQITLEEMIAEMIEHDLKLARKQRLLKDHGYEVNLSQE